MGLFDEQSLPASLPAGLPGRQPVGPRRPRITVSDVSAALGLTRGTVSRALNGYPDISSPTRERVRSTAARMGYRPLSHARAIRTGRALGLVIQIDDHDAHPPFLADFLAGISFRQPHVARPPKGGSASCPRSRRMQSAGCTSAP